MLSNQSVLYLLLIVLLSLLPGPHAGFGAPSALAAGLEDGLPGERLDLAALAAHPPLGLPPLADPPDADLIDLGRRLFFDHRLSFDGSLSCGSCHVPEQAFTQNGVATPVGIQGRFLRRNAPALYNVAYRPNLFHDGREPSLSRQIYSPLLAAEEMGNPDTQALLARVAAAGYSNDFSEHFPDGLTAESLGEAIAAYERALLSADSPFDRWYFGGVTDAMTAQAREGFFLFTRSGCSRCHRFSNRHAHFTDDAFHRTGIGHPRTADTGRMEATGRRSDEFRYRTPSLRNVNLTAPYMHDGSITTLLEVVQYYNSGAGADPGRDPSLTPLGLTHEQMLALVAFMEALTGSNVDALTADARFAGDRHTQARVAETGVAHPPARQSQPAAPRH